MSGTAPLPEFGAVPGHQPLLQGDPLRKGVLDRWTWQCSCGAQADDRRMTVYAARDSFRTHSAAEAPVPSPYPPGWRPGFFGRPPF